MSVDATFVSALRLPGVTDDERDVIQALLAEWAKHRPGNIKRSLYFHGKQPLVDAGIALPPNMKRLDAVLGWPEKACRALAQRNIWDGLVVPGQTQDPFGLADLLAQNQFALELPQAIMSTYAHSCAFLTVTEGDPAAGDPPVLIQPRSAKWSTALWDKRRREISAALAIIEADEHGAPAEMIVYLPGVALWCRRSGGRWSTDRRESVLPGVSVVPLTYDPQLDRPFGRSRITRPVMAITDRAVRTLLRTEVSAEFYAAPQRALLGADPEVLEDGGEWTAILGRVQAIGLDDEGNKPDYVQFPQMSMQPHSDMLRTDAALFSGETGVPMSSLGVVHDNPASAEAIYAAKEDLIIEAMAANRTFGAAVERVAQMAVMVRDGLREPTPELRTIEARFRNPANPSPVSASDALVKLATVFPWIGESEVALEMAGFTNSDITRLLADKRRVGGRSMLDELLAGGDPS